MILLSFTLALLTIMNLLEGIKNQCWPSQIVVFDQINSDYTLGPSNLLNFDNTIPQPSGQFFVNFWMRYVNLASIPNLTEMTVLRIGTVSAANSNLYMDIRLRKLADNNWRLFFFNEQQNIVFAANMNMFNHNRWWYISVGNDNGSLAQSMRVTAWNTVDQTVTLVSSEAWTFDQMYMRTFAQTDLDIFFFNGSIGKLDLIAGMYNLNDQRYVNFDKGLSTPIFLLDFTDPQYTQLLANRIVSSPYKAAIIGLNNHTDYADIVFNPVNGFAQRKFIHLISLPFFRDRNHVRQNMIVHQKFQGWALNHWNRGAEWHFQFSRWDVGNNYRYGYRIYKGDYSQYIRIYVDYGVYRHQCNYFADTAKPNHEGYTLEYGYIMHFYSPQYLSYSLYACSCNGHLSDGYYTQGQVGYAATDYFQIGQRFNPDAVFPNRPWNQQSAPMQVEIVFQLFIVTEDGYRSNPQPNFPNACSPNTREEYGSGLNSFKSMCNAGYSPYHENNMCILNPIASDYIDCAHDMDSVGSLCYRCLRYYGKNLNEGCFKCAANCIQCIGPGNDQCSYCGQGYGFTGTSCRKCTADETWDLSTNLCQLKKVRFIEAEYGYRTFGQIRLVFRPLNGDADLTLYEEQLFKKYWLNDINMRYYLVRDYTNVPLHRKVSVSFEYQIIDTRTYQFFYVAIDGNYVWDFSPNCEDSTWDIKNTYWNYGYLDMPPIKVSMTRFHSGNTMQFGLAGFWDSDWTTVWIRELNVTFFGCYEACATCWEDNSPVHCMTCLPGYYLVVSECKACNPQCATCVGTPTQCTSCPQNQFLKGVDCAVTCGLGFYADALNVCQACPVQCVQCNSPTSCNSCKNGFFLNVNTCSPCTGNCLTCTQTSTRCLSCGGATPKLQNFACVASCSSNFFEVAGQICNPCPPGCATCDSLTCLTCDPGFKPKANVCANPCGTGWYDAGASCQQCDAQCETCSGSSSNCLTCKAGRAQTPPSCPACTAPCTGCSSTATTCTTCSGSLFLTGSTCVVDTSCPAGTFASNNVCQLCTAPCATCQGSATFCLSCSAGVLHNNGCLISCPPGSTQFGPSTCCPNSCSACTNMNSCSACNPSFFLQGTTCPSCDPICATCSGTATNCLSCPVGKVLQGSTCQDTCLPKFYPNGQVCSPCHSTCATCLLGNLATQCQTCIAGHFLYGGICQNCADPTNQNFVSINGQCWDKCGTGRRFTPQQLPGLGGYNACDDGNLINGDGCSSDCRIESNFRCEGGTQTTPDKCYSKIKPTVDVVKVYGNVFQFQFSKPVRLMEGTTVFQIEDVFKVDLNGFKKPDNYTYNITMKDFDTSQVVASPGLASYDPSHKYYSYFNVTFNFSVTIPNNTRVTFEFERSKFLDVNGNSLKNQKLLETVAYNVTERHFAENYLNMTSKVSPLVTSFIPLASLGITNYVTHAWVRSISAIQAISFTKFINVEKTEKLQYVIGGAFNNSQRNIISPGGWFKEQAGVEKWDKTGQIDPVASGVMTTRILEFMVRIAATTNSGTSTTNTTTSTKSETETNSNVNVTSFTSIFTVSGKENANQFTRAGYANAMIPNLSFSILIVLIGGLWYFASNVLISQKVSVRSNCLVRFFAYGGERVLWISLILSVIELAMFSTNNVLNASFETLPRMLSTIAAIITFVFLVMFPYFIFKITNKHYTQLWNPEYYHRYAFLFCEFKLSKTTSKTFMSVLVGRFILYGMVIAALQNMPFGQTAIIALIQILYLVYLIKVSPFISKIIKILNYCSEGALSVVTLCYLALGFDTSRGGGFSVKFKDLVSNILIWATVIVIVVAIVTMVYMMVMKIWFTIKRCIDKSKIKDDPKTKGDSSAKRDGEEQPMMGSDDKVQGGGIQAAQKQKKSPEELEIDLEREFMEGGLGKRRGEGEFGQDENDYDLEKEYNQGQKMKGDFAWKDEDFNFDD